MLTEKDKQKQKHRHNPAFLSPTKLKTYIQAAQTNYEQDAIDALCTAFKPLILKEAYLPSVQASLGEDAENTAWEIFLEFMYKYQKHKYSDFPALLARTLHYRMLDQMHKEGGLEDCYALDADENSKELIDPKDAFLHSLNAIPLNNALEKLPSKQKEVVTEIYYHDRTLKECSRTTKLPLNTCYTCERRALKKLKNLLAE